MRAEGVRAEAMCRPVPRLSSLTRTGEIPYAEPATADEVRALAAQVRRRMRERGREPVDVHACVAQAARARGLIEVEGWGVAALKASAALTPRRGLAFEALSDEAGVALPIYVRPLVMRVADAPPESAPAPVRVRDILAVVSATYGVAVADLIGPRKAKHLILPRHVAAWLAKALTLRSLPDIGGRMGGRDHTTILHAVRRIEALRARDADFAAWLDLLKGAIRGDGADAGGVAT